MPSATPLSRANAKMIVTPRARRGRPNEPSDDWIAASFMEEVWPRRRGGSSESDSIPRAGRLCSTWSPAIQARRERGVSRRLVLGGDVGGAVLAVATPLAKVEGGNRALRQKPHENDDARDGEACENPPAGKMLCRIFRASG